MNTHLSRLLLRLMRRSRIEGFEELRKNAYLPPRVLREKQEAAFLRLVDHARTHVPYYRNLLRDTEIRSIEDIARIPPLTKKLIRGNREALRADNVTAERFVPNSTGGSTGEKLEFFGDRDTRSLDASLIMRCNSWAGWEPGERQLLLWGSHYDVSLTGGLTERLKNSLIRRMLILSSYDMTEGDMSAYCGKLNRYRPVLITGYPSAMTLFAEFIERKGLSVHGPRGIVTSAETLYEHQRKTIERVFGCAVHNRYGCREVGAIAQECGERKGLHVMAEHLIVEAVDETGAPCPAGRTGEILVTKLDNFAFPLIRYRIGDLGALSERTCPCGRTLPMLESVEGRVFDIIVGTNGNRVAGTFWTILMREHVRGVSSFQVVQEEYGKLLLRLVTDDGFDAGQEARLVRGIRDKCGEDMAVEIETVDEIPLTGSGKRRFIVSKVSPFLEGSS